MADESEIVLEEEMVAEEPTSDVPADVEVMEEVVEEVTKSNGSNEVITNRFDALTLDKKLAQDIQDGWSGYINSAPSREAAGEAIYAALFDSAPSLQGLFKTPRAVMAMRFMNGISSILAELQSPAKMKIVVETLGFQHLDLDVTVPRVIIFRDAILDLLEAELGNRMSTAVRNGLSQVLSWVGGAYIFIRSNFAGRLRILATSWATANNKKLEDVGVAEVPPEGEAVEGEEGAAQLAKADEAKKEDRLASGEQQKKQGGGLKDMKVPTTFNEMFMFNSAVMGFAGNAWMAEVLLSFDAIVSNVSNSYRLQEECDVLTLRMAKVKGNVVLSQFKAVMLASLRSLVPKDWNGDHEVAWNWLWENVERMLLAQMGKPQRMVVDLKNFLVNLDEVTQNELRKNIYATFFLMAPAGQDMFKQSTTRLYWIADKILEMTLDMFEEPKRMCDDISALGLRHVGYAPPTELFGPFVSACLKVVRMMTGNEGLEAAIGWSLGLISRMLVRTILEGSTIVMKAINANSASMMRKAVGFAPRSKRATWMLNITVGTQSISPLMWSIESGALDASQAMLVDLLTIRADRDRYYYGADELFSRHSDIVNYMCGEAPVLLSFVLDGLVWRSRLTEKGLRRVNIYLKNLMLEENGNFHSAMSALNDLRDSKIACHPVLILLSDTMWGGIVYRTFLVGKCWLLFTLCMFICSQAVLRYYAWQTAFQWSRFTVFGFRMFIYSCVMGELIITHLRNAIKDHKLGLVTKVWGPIIIPNRYFENWQEIIAAGLALFLGLMMSHCPVLYCFAFHNENYEGHGLLSETCPQAPAWRGRYGVYSMVAMILFFVRLIDLTVFSNRICAYTLMCGHVMGEVGLFLLALFFFILCWACAVSTLATMHPEFYIIPASYLTFLEIAFTMHDPHHYDELKFDFTKMDKSMSADIMNMNVIIYIMIILFIIIVFAYLCNLLIAQINCSFQLIFGDMVGFARVSRMQIIVATMPLISHDRWSRWVQTLHLDEKLEFNQGDVGLSGGVQMREAANANPTTVDSIRRFGGSTSPAMPWPEDTDAMEDGEANRLDRIEKVLQRIAKAASGGKAKKGGGSSGGGSAGAAEEYSGGGAEEEGSQ